VRDLTPAQERALDVAIGTVSDAVTRHDWDYAENLLDLMFRRLGLDPPTDSLGITEASGDA
jgi:hypothetical protein